jgi:hypothetical protein
MPQKITETALLQCDKGSTSSQLKVTSQNFCKADNKLLATEEDKKANKNIMPFGVCSITQKRCMLSPITWQQTTEKDTICYHKILLETSTCLCSVGGKISVKHKGHGIKSEAL